MNWFTVFILGFTLSCASLKTPDPAQVTHAPAAIGPQLDLQSLRDPGLRFR